MRALSTRDSTRPVPRISNPRARTIPRRPRRRGPTLTVLPSAPSQNHEKSEKYFFDRDKVKWVEWEKEAEAFKAVAGEEAKQKKVQPPPRRVGSSRGGLTNDDESARRRRERTYIAPLCIDVHTRKFHRASLRERTHRRLRPRGGFGAATASSARAPAAAKALDAAPGLVATARTRSRSASSDRI